MAIRSRRMRRRRMAPRRRPGRSYRRRTNRRNKYRANNILARGVVGLPPKMRMRMRHVGMNFPTIAGSGSTFYIMCTNLNDIYPGAAGNTRPLYFSQMAALYNRYFVHGFRYVIKIWNRSNEAQTLPLTVNVQVREEGIMDLNPATAAQRWYDKDRLCGPGLTVIKGYVPVGQPFGLSKRQTYLAEDFLGTITTGPTKQAFLNVLVQNPFASSTGYNLNLEVTYDVTWMELQDVAIS